MDMLNIKNTNTIEKDGVGVIVGRFQVPDLHEGHMDLINSVLERHDDIIIVLGLSAIKATKNNPLDYNSRRKMILNEFPDANIIYIKDTRNDNDWSRKLDEIIKDNIGPGSKVVAYGGRDSFIKHYNGFMETVEFQQQSIKSGTKTRKALVNKTGNTEEFRHGAIWATGNQYPMAFTTVDIAIMDEAGEKVLLARKENETKYRFVGGFIDPSTSEVTGGDVLEANARREVMEETHLEIGDLNYLGSFRVDDWRYRSEQSKINTILFKSKLVMGRPKPDDDIIELKWFPIMLKPDRKEIFNLIVDEHIPLMKKLLTTVDWSL
jgi:bifunctional NMN adenylyltransferase/nudix hydrolase